MNNEQINQELATTVEQPETTTIVEQPAIQEEQSFIETAEPAEDPIVKVVPASADTREAFLASLTPPPPLTADDIPPAEQPIAPPKDGTQAVQRQTAFRTETYTGNRPVDVSDHTASEPYQPAFIPKMPMPSTPPEPVTDLRGAILALINPKTFFPLTPLLRRYFGSRFASQEAAKETRVLLEEMHNSRKIIVNHNRHMQLGRPFYAGTDPKTQYWTLDKVAIEAMAANAPAGR